MNRKAKSRRPGFTLVEVVFVVALVAAILIALFPRLLSSREAARRAQCSNNLKQICLGLLNYEHANKTFPPGMICDKGEDPALTTVFRPNWAILTLPYLELSPLQRAFDLTVPLSNEKNRLWRNTVVPTMLCPADAANNMTPFAGANEAEGGDWARGNYAVNAGNFFLGKDGVVDANSPPWVNALRRGVMAVNDCTMGLAGIRDGTAQTILVGEIRAGVTAKDRRGVWAMGMAGSSIVCANGSWGDDNGPNACNPWADDIKGADQIKLELAPEDRCMDAWGKSGSRQATFRSLHPDGCNVVFADDSVHFISNTIETSGPWGDAAADNFRVWDRLICSSDKHAVDYRWFTDESARRPPPGKESEQELQISRAKKWREKSEGLIKVSGTVKYKDGTVPDGQYRFITFQPVPHDPGPIENFDPRKGAGGTIGPDGRFEAMTLKPGDGLLPGRYKVTIRCLKDYADPTSLAIPKKYADASTPPLMVTIDKPQSDMVFELEK